MTNVVEFDSMEPMETTQASLDHLTWENPMGVVEVAVPQTLFREILARIQQLRFLTIPARPG
ncbi:MAG: hypothetical protein WBC22_04065 [Sedimentisphaerales bacterium]